MEDLREYFECPICLCVPNSVPIFQCGKGHLICSVCRPKVTICPICRTRMPHDSRLLFAERLLEEFLPLPCKYSDDGCQIQLVSAQLRAHESVCDFSPAPCDNAKFGCRATPARIELKDHLPKCVYRLVRCPIGQCTEEFIHKQTEFHLKERHFSSVGFLDFNSRVVLALFAVCLFSLLINFFLLTKL